jgi:hypothetical protein
MLLPLLATKLVCMTEYGPQHSTISSPTMTSLLRAPASWMCHPSVVPCYGNAAWWMCRGRSWSRRKLGTRTPRQTHARRPWLTLRRMAWTYASGGASAAARVDAPSMQLRAECL